VVVAQKSERMSKLKLWTPLQNLGIVRVFRMTFRKQWLKEVISLCAEVAPEDGIDPRMLLHKPTRKNIHRKTYQVCKQAEKTLNLVLAGESAEPVLREVIVCAVEPNPDSTHLLVIVEANSTVVPLDENDVLGALRRAGGRLRSALATAINRKRTPQISFRFIAFTEVLR
jgi:ribosome-binding factor A